MNPKSYVAPDSIVRKIWSQADMVLFIFASSAAEFALNKNVDWLYFTGKLPKDPLGRMFSTVAYARAIIWMNETNAHNTIAKMKQIHLDIEQRRKMNIPESAFRDVLYMLIGASIKANEVLDYKLKLQEQQEVFDVLIKMGNEMGITGLATNYSDWQKERLCHLENHLNYSRFTQDLFHQFKKQLGAGRYFLLLNIQEKMVEKEVSIQMRNKAQPLATCIIHVYKKFRKLRWVRKNLTLLMPYAFRNQMNDLTTIPIH